MPPLKFDPMFSSMYVPITQPTAHFGGDCLRDSSQNFYISNCGFSGAYDALSWLLGDTIVSKLPGS